MALTTGIALLSSQYAYNSNGPFDAKMLVGTTEELYSPATWQNKEGENLAYNGMIVAVWRERNENAYKNGIYLLHDGKANNKFLIDTTDITRSTISKPESWHKIGDLNTDIDVIKSHITRVEEILNGKEAIGEEGTEGYQPAQKGLLEQVAQMVGSDSTEISADTDGTLKINVNKLVQRLNSDNEVFVLSGGSANSL